MASRCHGRKRSQPEALAQDGRREGPSRHRQHAASDLPAPSARASRSCAGSASAARARRCSDHTSWPAPGCSPRRRGRLGRHRRLVDLGHRLDDEVDDERQDDKLDDRVDEQAVVQRRHACGLGLGERLRPACRPRLTNRFEKSILPRMSPSGGISTSLTRELDDLAERAADDDADGEVDDVASRDELAKSLSMGAKVAGWRHLGGCRGLSCRRVGRAMK